MKESNWNVTIEVSLLDFETSEIVTDTYNTTVKAFMKQQATNKALIEIDKYFSNVTEIDVVYCKPVEYEAVNE